MKEYKLTVDEYVSLIEKQQKQENEIKDLLEMLDEILTTLAKDVTRKAGIGFEYNRTTGKSTEITHKGGK